MSLTPLETDVLHALHTEFEDAGFPSPDRIAAVEGENTGTGRFTDLASEAVIAQPSPCALSWIIRMDGLQHGLGALVFLADGKMQTLELHLWGDDGWDGVERPWEIGPDKVHSDA